MSKNEVVSETGANRGSDAEGDESDGGGTEPVDIGIGIAVEIDADALEAVDDADTDVVELEFDEAELLEADVASRRDAGADGQRIEADQRDRLEAVDVDPDAVAAKEYSYRMLLDAGVDESDADALRRQFSLPWSFDGDGDLERRSSEVRGLGDAEREWIAVSGDERWQSFDYEHSPLAAVSRERPSERPYPKPTPVTAVTGVGPDDADELAEAGVRSAERLATVSAFAVANALGLDVLHVRTWRHNAREMLG
ncbi:hypothetical protein [Haloterrigena alkaliphila]|uniref:Helix-hairpin-helix domain-containing protein n=1 Tax=Haloterrigena alkaliphila TaxID=2816475 RepID=A0A8A2VCY9_9EURY|nr:hypothetical protein [Haloterrigena alkaliphila]QSW98272.1 hypothetical protein J0X25_12795 [Haloterrigena alkaliphila]